MTPDVNVLVAAFRPGHAHHRAAREWLSGALQACGSGGSVEILPMVAAGFLRLVTNPKVFPVPAPAAEALAFLRRILDVPGVTMPPTGAEWSRLETLCTELDLRGNDIPDAWIAAAVTVGGWRLVTFDRGFARLLRRSEYVLLGDDAGVQERKSRYASRRRGRRRAA